MNVLSKLIEVADSQLKPYSMRNANTRGRKYSEPNHPYRLPYERDKGRIVHSTAWRRLEYKTQVFVNHEGDHFRTRMTHSIEVASIARVLCIALGLNADLSEAIALAHDLGHTPFGHCGETTLNELMKEHGGFEHNRQSHRVVSYLESRYPDFCGLNLSYEVLDGLIKHASRYDNPTMDLFVDNDLFPSLEAQVVNIADELTYTSHDFDDGIYSGLISLDEMIQEIPLIAKIHDTVRANHPDIDNEMLRKQMVRELINYQVTDCFEHSLYLLNKYNPQSATEAQQVSIPLINISSDLRGYLEKLETYLYHKLYKHYKVIRMTEKSNRLIEGLFNAFMKEPRQLPSKTHVKLNKEPLEIIVADYIAGMTDRYAMYEHRNLYDPYVKMIY